MKAFEYASPTTAEEAVKDLAGSSSAEALSGGTDLISRMKDYVSSPARVYFIRPANLSRLNLSNRGSALRVWREITLDRALFPSDD